MQSFVFDGIGTAWTIDHLPRLDGRVAGFIESKIKDIVSEFDQHYSRFKKDSDVSIWSQKKGTHTLPDNAKEMFDLYYKFYVISNGAFTPLIGSVMEQAGYDAAYSLQPGSLHKPYSWEESIQYEYPHITFKKPAILDFGALGKGHLIDTVAKYLIQQGIDSFCIDAGGDLYFHDSLPLRIGLEHPVDTSKIIGEVEIKNQSICASAGNRRNWGEYHHIIDPRTLASSNHILASWVICDKAILADAVATALFLMEPEVLQKEFSFEYLLLYPDYSTKKSEKFPAQMYYT